LTRINLRICACNLQIEVACGEDGAVKGLGPGKGYVPQVIFWPANCNRVKSIFTNQGSLQFCGTNTEICAQHVAPG